MKKDIWGPTEEDLGVPTREDYLEEKRGQMTDEDAHEVMTCHLEHPCIDEEEEEEKQRQWEAAHEVMTCHSEHPHLDEEGINWTEERGVGLQDLRYGEMEREYGVHPRDHFHWRVVVTFESGLQHTNEWHAKIEDAERLVTETARITHDQEKGNRGVMKTIQTFPLDTGDRVLPKVEPKSLREKG